MLAWERQPGESTKAFEAFALYRDLGSGRSLAKVGQMLGKSTALMERWSVRYGWVPRIQALEARDEMIRRDAIEQHIQAQAQDHGRREAQLQEKALAAREEAMEMALKVLKWPISEQRVVTTDEDGAEVTYLFMPAKWAKRDAVAFYHMAVGDAPAELPDAPVELDLSEMSEEQAETWLRLSDLIGFKPPGKPRQ